MPIEVNETKNYIDIQTSINEVIAQMKRNFIELSETKNYVDIKPVINYLEFIENNTDVTVTQVNNYIDIVQQAATVLDIKKVINYIDVVEQFTYVDVKTTRNYIEINNNPPNVDVDEAEIMYKKRTDFVTDTLIYKGTAAPGALTSAAVWRISRTTIDLSSNGDISEDFANGSDGFISVWDDRATLNYG